MKHFLTVGLTALMGFYCLKAPAQDKTPAPFTKEDLISDYKLAIEILKKQHPNLYKFIDSASFERKADSLIKKAEAQPDVLTCGQYSPLQLVKDVHTSLGFSVDASRDLYSMISHFPFPVIIERGKMLMNIRGTAIPFGAEVTGINDIPVQDILKTLSAYTYSDGYITTGTDRMYANFQLLFSQLAPHQKTYEISYIVPGSTRIKKTTFPAANPTEAYHASQKAIFPVNLLQRSYYVYRDYFDDIQTGVITVNTFGLNEAGAYKEFSDFFREVNKRQYKRVIIDIRNNGGGNPGISALLYSFLAKNPFRNVYNYRTRTIDIANPEYAIADNGRKLTDEDIQANKNFLYQRFDKDSSGFYVGNARLRDGLLEDFPVDKNAFKGSVYVLTSGGTVSAATYFASLVQKNKRGEIIGKETGSGADATTAAWFMKYMLPKTKCILTVPMSELYFFNAAIDHGRGILPDKEVPLDKFITYMQTGEDPEMAYTLELIKLENTH